MFFVILVWVPRWCVDFLINVLQPSAAVTSILLNVVVLGSLAVSIYLGVTRKWLYAIPQRWRVRFRQSIETMFETILEKSTRPEERVSIMRTTTKTFVATGAFYKRIWSRVGEIIEEALAA